MSEKRGNRSGKEPKTGRIGERPYPFLYLSILVRAAHQVGAAVFLAAYLLDAIPGPPMDYMLVALVTGGLLLAFEWMRHRQGYREVAGMITIVKVFLLGAAYHGYLPAEGTVLLAFLLASFGSHAPKKVRHRLLY